MSTVSRLFFFFNRKEKFQVFGLALMMYLGAMLEAGSIGMVAPLIALLRDPGIIQTNKFFRAAFDFFGMTSAREFLVWFAVGLLGVHLVKSAFLILVLYIQNRFICYKVTALQVRLFRAYLSAPYVYHLANNSSELQSKASDQVRWVMTGVFVPFLTALSETMLVAVMIGMLVLVDPSATLLVMFLVGTVAFLFFRAIRKRLERLGQVMSEATVQVVKWANQGFGCIKEAKILRIEPFFIDAFSRQVSIVSNSQTRAFILGQIPRSLIETLGVMGLLLVVAVLLMRGRPFESILPMLVLLAASAVRLIPSTNRILNALGQMRMHNGPMDIIYDDLTALEKFERTTPAARPATLKNSRPKVPFVRAIELRNVSYKYPGAARPVIQDLSLLIPKGSSIGLVGPSGAGKTTLVDIILGLLEPTQGEVLVDGVNIYQDMAGWYGRLGYIPQVIYLCDDTIRRNVALGLPQEDIDDEKVRAALKGAQLEELVESLPDGFDTSIGERGVRLSGGERQRIGIARALYHDPDVLVLDEATSSLDHETEMEVSRAIARLSGIKTLIIIAHRLSTVKNCDTIHSLRAGVMAGEVSYNDLVSKIIQ